ATTIIGGAPAYLRSLDRVGVEGVLESLPPVGKNIVVTNDGVPSRLTAAAAVAADIDQAADTAFGAVATPARRALRSPYHQNLDPITISDWSLARFVLMDGLVDNVKFVGGGPPESPNGVSAGVSAEAAILADLADDLGIAPGDTLTLRVARGSGSAVDVFISGVFEIDDAGSAFWMGFAGPLARPSALPGFPGEAAGLFVTEQGFGAVVLESAALPMDAVWIVDLDQDRLKKLDDGAIIAAADGFESQIEQAVPGSFVITGLGRAFGALERRVVFARIPMFLMATILLTIVGYYLFMAAGVLASRRRDEIGMLRSRGISLFQMGRLYGLEAAALVSVSVILGPLISTILIAQAGRVPPFDDITGGETMPVAFGWDQYVFAFVAGLIALAVLIGPVLATGAKNVVIQRRTEAGPEHAPFFQRYFLDAALLALAGFLVWELDARGGEVLRVDQDGGLSMDPTVFFAPALVLFGVSLVLLRLFPPALRMAAGITARFGPAWVALAVWRLSRAPYFYAPVVLLLTLASGLAIVAATLASTLQDNAEERVLYDSGSDIHVEGARGAFNTVDTVREFSSVSEASAAMRAGGRVGTTDTGPEFELLAVQSDRFAHVAWFRSDFAEVGLPALMDLVSSGTVVEPLLLPESASEIGVWAQTDDEIEHLFLWATVRGATGIVETITLGPVERGEWRLQTASLERTVAPVELLSIKLFEPAGEDRATAGSILFDDIVAIDAITGESSVVVDFDELDRWTAFPTSEGLDALFSVEQEYGEVGASPGDRVGRLTFGRGTDGGVRGIYRSASGGPLPVIVSSTLARAAGITLDVPFIARLSSSLTPLVAVGTADFFPTLDPDDDDGFMVADLDDLAQFLDLKGVPPSDKIEELFIAVAPQRDDAALRDVESVLSPAARVEVQLDRREESLVDPLSVAGWRGVGLLAGITTMIAVVLGYLTYLRAYSGKMETEEAFVRSMGFSRPNYVATAAIEHLFLGLVGIVLGAVSGLVMSGLAVDVSSRTSDGREPLPPFILATRWEPVLFGYAALVIIAVIALGLLTVRYSRRPLHEATRVQK
ncbi:MAG: FtsX-like permease family protein, partial [Chloroflexi bacterium]|nr:FtsX-like permease family protein [Chloroflexota bacterium]